MIFIVYIHVQFSCFISDNFSWIYYLHRLLHNIVEYQNTKESNVQTYWSECYLLVRSWGVVLQYILGVVRLKGHLKAASSITVDYHPFNIITYHYSLSVYSFPALYQFCLSIVTQESRISKYNRKYSCTYWSDCYLLIRSWGIVILCILDVVRFLGHLKTASPIVKDHHPLNIKHINIHIQLSWFIYLVN